MNRKSQKKIVFLSSSRKGGHGCGLSSNGALPWRKWRLRPSRRPWLVSPIALTRLSPPLTTAVFAGRLAQLTPTSREAERAAIARALGLDVPAPVRAGADREPLRDSSSRVRTVLCVRSVPHVYVFVYLSPTGTKKTSVWSGMFTHPTSPYATAEPVPALPSIVCIVRMDHGFL